MISYAQNFEDVILYRVFRNQPTGFYIDVGAADPVHHSVTKWFYDLGWRGINIEPHSRFFQALQQQRPRDINLNCGAGAAVSKALYVEMEGMPEWSSFDVAAQRAAAKRDEGLRQHRLPILTLNEIIKRHAAGGTIDFLKIDVEGWEQQVLSGLDLKRHRPTIIVVEATQQGSPECSDLAWEKSLTDADYRVVYFDGLNKFYLEGKHSELAKHFAVPPNVFDDYKLHDWQALLDESKMHLKEAQAESADRLKAINALEKQNVALNKRFEESEADRAARLDAIKALDKERVALTKRLSESEADRAARQETAKALEREVATLNRQLDESEADRSARLEIIEALAKTHSEVDARLAECEADRGARLLAIEALNNERMTVIERLAESEADRAARLDVIKALESNGTTLSARLSEAEAAHAASLEEIRNLQAERAALLDRVSQSEAKCSAQVEHIAYLVEEGRELSARLQRTEAELGRIRADIASRDTSLTSLRREIEAVGKSLGEGMAADDEAVLQILRRAKRILDSRLAKLAAKLTPRS